MGEDGEGVKLGGDRWGKMWCRQKKNRLGEDTPTRIERHLWAAGECGTLILPLVPVIRLRYGALYT